MGVELSQSMRQSQTLAPEMRQSLDILHMTTVELRTELAHQLQTNPVLEAVGNPMERPLGSALPEKPDSGAITERELDFDPNGARANETLSAEDGCRDYFLGNLENFHREDQPAAAFDSEASARRQRFFDNQVSGETLQDHLFAQVPLSDLDDSDRELARILIGDIDGDGYYRGSTADVEMVYGATPERIDRALRAIGAFDPLGCGARNARECLLAQMEKLDDSPWEDEARALVSDWMPALAAHREDDICSALKITRAELGEVLKELRNLDPHPGRAFRGGEDKSLFVNPELVAVRDTRGRWRVRAVSGLLPQVRISAEYEKMSRDSRISAEDRSWLRERIHAAETLIDALDEREGTLVRVAQAIADAQPDYFEKGPSALRPLKMDRIAEIIGVHPATVSRTVDGKYMRTPFGTVALRSFFSAAITTASGVTVSNSTVRTLVGKYIAEEDKSAPLSDDRIATLLKSEHGLAIARRTVAKYRSQLNLPAAAARAVK